MERTSQGAQAPAPPHILLGLSLHLLCNGTLCLTALSGEAVSLGSAGLGSSSAG